MAKPKKSVARTQTRTVKNRSPQKTNRQNKKTAPATLTHMLGQVEKEFKGAIKALASNYDTLRKESTKLLAQLKKDLSKEQKNLSKLKNKRDQIKTRLAKKKTPVLKKQSAQVEVEYRGIKQNIQNIKAAEQHFKIELKTLKTAEQKFQLILKSIEQIEKTTISSDRKTTPSKSPKKTLKKGRVKASKTATEVSEMVNLEPIGSAKEHETWEEDHAYFPSHHPVTAEDSEENMDAELEETLGAS